MRAKKLVRTALILLMFTTQDPLFAQYFEVGASVGGSNYLGELSDQQWKISGTHGAFGVFGRYNANRFLSFRTGLVRAVVSGSDEHSRRTTNVERNLNFRSNLMELSLIGEINLSPYNVRAYKTAVPYLFAGVAGFHFHPQAQMRGAWYDLRPARTEGVLYRQFAFSVPFGFGLKFSLSEKVNLGLELGVRKTFTDRLDDVSESYPDVMAIRSTDPLAAALSYRTPELTGTFGENPYGLPRGDASNTDWYMMGALHVSVNLTDKFGLDFDPRYEPFKKKPVKRRRTADSQEVKRF
ncbi:MAG: hypothetical protein RLY31_518 [Bacteroidota bacterium]|jgi:hypothetical protein